MKRYVKATKVMSFDSYNLTPQMIADLQDARRCYEAGDYHKIFNLLHAYLRGLEHAGVITAKEHEDIFAEIMDID